MSIKKQLLAGTIASLMVLGGSAMAGSYDTAPPAADKGIYIGAHGGLAMYSGDYSDSIDNGYDIGMQIGYRFNKNIRVEGAYDYMSQDVTDVDDSSINASVLMVNGYYDFDFGSKFVPYVGVGIGSLMPSATYSDTSITNSDQNQFAYQGIVGVDYKVSEKVSVGVNYRYMSWTDTDYMNGSENIISASINYAI
jgi:OOP family OmpA-OmpF porin